MTDSTRLLFPSQGVSFSVANTSSHHVRNLGRTRISSVHGTRFKIAYLVVGPSYERFIRDLSLVVPRACGAAQFSWIWAAYSVPDVAVSMALG